MLTPALGLVLLAAAAYLAGALAAASVNSLAALGAVSPAFKPLWSALHAAALALGLAALLAVASAPLMHLLGRPDLPTGSLLILCLILLCPWISSNCAPTPMRPGSC